MDFSEREHRDHSGTLYNQSGFTPFSEQNNYIKICGLSLAEIGSDRQFPAICPTASLGVRPRPLPSVSVRKLNASLPKSFWLRDGHNIGRSEKETNSAVRVVGEQGADAGRYIYQIEVDGQKQNIAVTLGDNGYLVGANPKSRSYIPGENN